MYLHKYYSDIEVKQNSSELFNLSLKDLILSLKNSHDLGMRVLLMGLLSCCLF